jgi:hypothetical protein
MEFVADPNEERNPYRHDTDLEASKEWLWAHGASPS